MESTATSGRPAGCRSGVSGWTTSRAIPERFSSLRVATTSPITRASCILVIWSSLFADLHRIDNADDGGVNGTVLQSGGHSSRTPAHDEDRFADTGIDRIDRDEGMALRLSPGIDGLHDHQLFADQARVLSGRDDGA